MGTPRRELRHRANPNEPTPDAVAVIEPAFPLEGDSLEMFDHLVAEVRSLGILHAEHAHKLTLAAMAYDLAVGSWDEGDRSGFKNMSGEFRQLVAGYGLDPASMTKVGGAPKRRELTEREKLDIEFFGAN